jgi:hypothetical protein
MIRVTGWPDRANVFSFLRIVHEFTGADSANVRSYMERLKAGETLELRPCELARSVAFAEKLLRFGVVSRAESQDSETGDWEQVAASVTPPAIRATVHGHVVEVSCYGSGSDWVCRLTDPSCQSRRRQNDAYCPPPDLGFLWLRESHGMWLASGLVNREVFRDTDTVDAILYRVMEEVVHDFSQLARCVEFVSAEFTATFDGEQGEVQFTGNWQESRWWQSPE